MIIDSDAYAAAGVETLFFPGGEPHAKIPDVRGNILLFLKLRTWNDVGLGACVIDAFSRSHANWLEVFIPYFPAARQDKSDGRAPLTVQLTGPLLTNNRGGVHVFDPHSSVLLKAARIARVFMPSDLDIPVRPDVIGVIAPDAGAVARANEFRDRFYPGKWVLECEKTRNPRTGALSGYVLPPLPFAGRYVIVDDICDGGGTFNLLAKEFAADPLASASQLELFVSHGIFSKGLGAIDPVIEHITTTDSWCRLPSDSRLTVLPLSPLFPRIIGER